VALGASNHAHICCVLSLRDLKHQRYEVKEKGHRYDGAGRRPLAPQLRVQPVAAREDLQGSAQVEGLPQSKAAISTEVLC